MTPHQLFDLAPPLLKWLPGESLFSLTSRQHAFWGYSNAGTTAKVLFGGQHSGVHHDFPSGLDEFDLRTSSVFGAVEEIALNHTLLSYYRPFVSPDRIVDCLAMMRSQRVTHLKYRLGLLTSRFRANHPLKACLTCMAQDMVTSGWSYWHLEHQYPGVWVCPLHGGVLYESTIKSTGVNRFFWALPDSSQLNCHWRAGDSDVATLEQLSKLTLHIVQQARVSGWLSGSYVVPVFREMIRGKGGLTRSGNLRSSELARSYLAWCKRLGGPMELRGLPTTQSEAELQVNRLFKPWRTGTHPLRVLTSVCWLFADVDSFIAAYDKVHPLDDQVNWPDRPINPSAGLDLSEYSSNKSRLLRLVESGISATAASTSVGVTVGTAMAWLAQSNFKVSRRPKSFKAHIQTALKVDLLKGESKSYAAETHHVSVQTVTRFLRTEPGLYQEWKDAIRKKTLLSARESWFIDLAEFGHLGTKWIRLHNPAIYAWLYRNDRAWLQANLPPLPPRVESKSTLDWVRRDLELSAETEKIVEQLKAAQPNKQLFLWQIYQAMPQLKPKLSVLNRLPLTRLTIERALGRVTITSQKNLI